MLNSLQTPLLAAMAAGALLSACGGGNDPAPAATVTGVFLDAAVEGLDYVAGTAAKVATNAKGEFTCQSGDTVTFSMGAVTLGSAPCSTVITPLSLAGGTDIKADKVMNRLLALQSFDEDGDPSNGIKLASDVKSALGSRTMDFSLTPDNFNKALAATLAVLPEAYKTRPADDAKRTLVREHFEDTLASKTGAPVSETVTQTNTLGPVSATITRLALQADKKFYIPYEGSEQRIKNEFPQGFLPAYGSGLAFKGKQADGTLEFYAVTDRGPNGDGPMVPNTAKKMCYERKDANCDGKLFPAPSFVPSFGVITVGKDGAVLTSSMPILVSSTVKTTGLPAGPGQLGASGEAPLTDNLKHEASSKATYSTIGLDPESLVIDTARNALWISDEYGPFIVKIDPVSGIILKKYGPAIPAGSTVTAEPGITTVLPSILAKRRANRGMEGLALDAATGKLHGFLQSPLTDLSATGAAATGAYVAPTGCDSKTSSASASVERYARFTRWVEFDPQTETSRMYAFPISCADYKDNRTGNAKLGDMVSLGQGKFIVIEQGADSVTGAVFNRLMLVEIGSATDISQAAFNPATSDLEKSSMAAALVNGADYSGVTTLKKTLLLDLNKVGWLAEKAEGLALVDGTTLALTSDNDFGLRNIVLNAAGVEVSGADITKCTSTDGVLSGCGTGTSSRVGRGTDAERSTRLWLIKFSKNLADFSVTTP